MGWIWFINWWLVAHNDDNTVVDTKVQTLYPYNSIAWPIQMMPELNKWCQWGFLNKIRLIWCINRLLVANNDDITDVDNKVEIMYSHNSIAWPIQMMPELN